QIMIPKRAGRFASRRLGSSRKDQNPDMSRQPQNEAFARTSFLQGANAAYLEEMQAPYEKNPGAGSDDTRLFFPSLSEEKSAGDGGSHGPSWARPLEELSQNGNSDLVAALTGDYAEQERHLREKLQGHAQRQGFELGPLSSLRATQDSIRALM